MLVEMAVGKRATIVGSDGRDKLKGTKKKDVIVGNGGNDTICVTWAKLPNGSYGNFAYRLPANTLGPKSPTNIV